MSNDRLKFRARLGVSYYDDAGNDVDGMLVIDNVAAYHDGSVGFSEESLADAIDRLAKTDRENESIWQYVEDNFSTESDLWYWAAGAIVEQCTGEKDKNNNLIYDGDRVQKDGYIGTVKFGTYSKDDCGGKDAILGFYIEWDNAPLWRKDFNYWVREGIEIIGNIHEQKDTE